MFFHSQGELGTLIRWRGGLKKAQYVFFLPAALFLQVAGVQ